MERKILKPGEVKRTRRRFEWVSLPDGDVCVWSLSMSEALDITHQSQRPGNLGADEKMSNAIEMQIICRAGEPDDEEAAPIFASIQQVFDLPWEEFLLLHDASLRVNGRQKNDNEALKAFFDPAPAKSNSR
jgi:hypothetical protein